MSARDRQITFGGGTWFLLLFGLGFAGIGTVFLITLLSDPASVTVNDRPGRYSDAWMPCIFIAIGLGIIGIRGGKRINFEQRTIRSWWGWWFFCRTTQIELGTWEQVEIGRREQRGSGSGSYPAIPVSVIGSNDKHELDAPRNEQQARRLAERVAKAAGLSVIDKSGGEPVVRTVDTLDEPLMSHVTDADVSVEKPARCRFRVSDDGRATVIRMGFSSSVFFLPLAIVPFGFMALFWYFLWFPGTGDKAERDLFSTVFAYLPLIMIALPLLFLVVRQFFNGAFGHTIRIDPDAGIRVLGKRLAPTDIEEVRIMPGKFTRHLAVISDRNWITIGHGLRDDELTYLRAVILKALTGRP